MPSLRLVHLALALVAAPALAAPAFADSIAASDPDPGEIVATGLLPRPVKQSLRRLTAASASAAATERLLAARSLIESGRVSGDPRTLGYAESVLAAWPTDAGDTPVDALVLHATIAQSRHRFEQATALLDRVLARADAPASELAQARLTRATIHQVTGRFDAARADCNGIAAVARAVAAICGAALDASTGRTEAAVTTLRAAAQRTTGAVRAWALAALAQAHEQRGESSAAQAAYRAALLAHDDHATRLALADNLLESGDAAGAATLLKDAPPSDATLLRRWRSARRLGADAAGLQRQLSSRLDEAQRRADGSDLLHARDWAQFALERGDTARALVLAKANWSSQREPADLLVLARSAAAAHDAATLRDVRSWLAQTGLQDVRVDLALRETGR
jgi:tetratricopeptide (TPR) repeat protein